MHTLILDIGGIFFSPEWRMRGIAEMADAIGCSQAFFLEALELQKKQFYCGKISEDEYWLSVQEYCHSTWGAAQYAKAYRSYVTPISASVALLPRLSQYNILMSCNNSPKEWMDERVAMCHLQNFFTQFYTSGYVGHKKPSEHMFSAVFDHAQRLEHPIVYIDDNMSYLDAASRLYPQHTYIHYTKPDDLLRWVR
ncbi:MAG: HAD hydrolase-like protein [Candidatus Kerfeldbacteria bacterium]|nr:HAD hydrolase-like protein [Candidatus Kerfeldbacteria bacterium]